MESPLTHLSPETRLCRKEVQYHLKWSRTTLWRREREGLHFVDGLIQVGVLRDWLERWARQPAQWQGRTVFA